MIKEKEKEKKRNTRHIILYLENNSTKISTKRKGNKRIILFDRLQSVCKV